MDSMKQPTMKAAIHACYNTDKQREGVDLVLAMYRETDQRTYRMTEGHQYVHRRHAVPDLAAPLVWAQRGQTNG